MQTDPRKIYKNSFLLYFIIQSNTTIYEKIFVVERLSVFDGFIFWIFTINFIFC